VLSAGGSSGWPPLTGATSCGTVPDTDGRATSACRFVARTSGRTRISSLACMEVPNPLLAVTNTGVPDPGSGCLLPVAFDARDCTPDGAMYSLRPSCCGPQYGCIRPIRQTTGTSTCRFIARPFRFAAPNEPFSDKPTPPDCQEIRLSRNQQTRAIASDPDGTRFCNRPARRLCIRVCPVQLHSAAPAVCRPSSPRRLDCQCAPTRSRHSAACRPDMLPSWLPQPPAGVAGPVW